MRLSIQRSLVRECGCLDGVDGHKFGAAECHKPEQLYQNHTSRVQEPGRVTVLQHQRVLLAIRSRK